MGLLDTPPTLAKNNLSALGIHLPEREGAKGDVQSATGGVMTASSGALTLAGVTFTQADVGKTIIVQGAGAALYSTTVSTGSTIALGASSLPLVASVPTGLYQIGSEQRRITVIAGSGPYTATLQSNTTVAHNNGDAVTFPGALLTTIASVSGGAATLTANAVTSVSSAAVTWGTDDTTAVQAALNRVTDGAPRVYLSKRYLITSTLTCAKPVRIEGAGSGYTVDAGGLPNVIAGLIYTSSSTDCLSLTNAAGSTLHDFGVVYLGVARPTAGSGVHAVGVWHGHFERLTISGFWNNLTVDGWYYTVQNCRIYDPVNYGLYMATASSTYNDHGDMGVVNNVFSMVAATYDCVSLVRWESGGGLRFANNKVNSFTQPGNNFTGRHTYGLDIAVVDGCSTSVFDIVGNSIENALQANIRITQSGSTGSGFIEKLNISGNEIFGGVRGIYILTINSQTNSLRAVSIWNNTFASHTTGIDAASVNLLSIGTNQWYGAIATCIKLSRFQYATDIARQMLDGADNHTIVSDTRTLSGQNGDIRGRIEYAYDKAFKITATNVWQNTHKVVLMQDGTYGSTALIELIVNGYHDSTGPFQLRWLRAATVGPTGNVTLTTVGTDSTVGAGQVTAQFVTTTAGTVQVQVQLPTGASVATAEGKATVKVDGYLASYYCGT